MAEEDLIFGKNRHFFGGIEPSNMLKFYTVSKSNYIRITVSLPKNTVINDQTLCTVSGAVIRKSEEEYPKDEFSGTLVMTVEEDGLYYDYDIEENKTYYYAAFPYTTQGVYARNIANRSVAVIHSFDMQYLFGYDLNINDTDPTTRVSYPSDVQNYDFESAYMDYTNSKFVYGGWPSEAGQLFMPVPGILSQDCQDFLEIDPNDYTKDLEGNDSNITSTSLIPGNAMMRWPKIYTSRTFENDVYKFRCSDQKIDETYECWCNYDINNIQIPYFYTPIYFGCTVSSVLRSISGQSCSVSTTANQEVERALANGDGWYTETFADRMLIIDLLTMIGKSTDGQTIYGTGRCKSSNTSAISNGTMDKLGLFYGYTDQTSGVKVFGMENWWGNTWRRTAGWINDNGTQKIKITRGNYDKSEATDYNFDGEGYITLEGATPVGTSGGYIDKCLNTIYGRIPYSVSGTSSTNECDGQWFNNSQINYARCGGAWTDALLDGPSYVALGNLASYTHTAIGAALSCKPLA